MSLPVVSQSSPEVGRALDQLLLFLDPGRHNLLPLDDLVQEVFRRVEKRTRGIVIGFDVLPLASGDVFELAARDGVFYPLVRETGESLKRRWHCSSAWCEAFFELLAHCATLFIAHLVGNGGCVHGGSISSVGESLTS